MPLTEKPDERLALLHRWLETLPAGLALLPASLRPASSDASFRRYFRVDSACGTPSFIVMDAPPAQEDCRPFVDAARRIAARGVNTPQVVAQDLDLGLLLLTDLGARTYFDVLAPDLAAAGGAPLTAAGTVARLYDDALEALVRMQGASCEAGLPPYDRDRLLAEMRLFPDWYVERHLGAQLSAAERAVLDASFEQLVKAALAQPAVFVHRDYHCRNLMALDESIHAHPRAAGAKPLQSPGVLDFQDAVAGPATYDLVSLLRDAYVEWSEPQQIDWAARYWERARAAGIPVADRFDTFWRDLEWMGLQRTLKILGIFARLFHRDGKERYLADLPLVLRHTERVVHRYDAFAPLGRLLDRLHGRAAGGGMSF